MTTWRAPGRVNVIGEHTDYNDGFVLPIALPLAVEATIRTHDGRGVLVASASESDHVELATADIVPGAVSGWSAYVYGVVWALTERGHTVPPLSIGIAGDVPYGAGLSSSAALECAVAAAIDDHLGLGLSRDELVAVARAAENDFVGVPSGSLDQSASMLCLAGHAMLLDTRTGHRRQVPFDLAAHSLSLLVIDTRAPHRLVDGEYASRRADCEAAARALDIAALRDVDDLDIALAMLDDPQLRRRVRHVVSENERVRQTVALLDAGEPISAIGALLTASHVSLRDDYEVSSPELDTAVDAALRAGAYGARMTGGGFGGSAIALTDAGSADDVGDQVAAAFAAAGLRAPRVFAVVPSSGAARV